jgi:hypothetical protein
VHCTGGSIDRSIDAWTDGWMDRDKLFALTIHQRPSHVLASALWHRRALLRYAHVRHCALVVGRVHVHVHVASSVSSTLTYWHVLVHNTRMRCEHV